MAHANIPGKLMDWFAGIRRDLPWRTTRRDPYRTWVAETMLQQTRVEAVVPYYERFLDAFPGVEALAGADEDEVLRLWAGLGYYRRARLLHRAAAEVCERGGSLPIDAAGWRALPGVGEYTAAAVASLACGEAVPVVDGNVKRVAARVLGLSMAADEGALHRAAREWGETLMAALPEAADPGALNEALMELGATCCTPRAPRCELCPLRTDCAATASREGPEAYPAARRPVEWKDVALQLLVARRDDRFVLHRREQGWNPGLYEPPSADGAEPAETAWVRHGYRASGFRELGDFRHAITRHRIRAQVLLAEDAEVSEAAWQDAEAVALTGLAKKALRLAGQVLAGVVVAFGATGGLSAAVASPFQEPAPDDRPVGHVPTVEQAPRLDGLLDDPVWQQACVLDGFRQSQPVEGVASDPRTEVLLMRTDTHLYVGFICYEPEPSKMVLHSLTRDSRMFEEDHVIFAFDTFHDRRNSYFFQVAAAGGRGDALVGDNGKRFNKPWDGFWRAKTKILADRWTAEIEIPFAMMSFGGQEKWGANFRRTRAADRSEHQWSTPRREVFVSNVREAGTLTGFGGIPDALGLELKPYLKTRWGDDRFGAGSDFDFTGGGELSWRITPQMTASLTVNTDFAETEVDERRINLGRFPLFFPEKRDFFLEDTTKFQFGEQSGFGGGGGNFIPFFSRRIGLLDGDEVPIDYGLRVAGRAGPMDIGLLGVRVGDAPGGLAPSDELLVARPSFQVSEDVAVGALFTSGDPAADTDNTVAGADLRWSTSDGLPGTLSVNAFAVWTDDEASGREGLGGGVQADLRTGDWTFRGKVIGTQPDFRPALGFIRRPGELFWSGSVSWDPYVNGGSIRSLGFQLSPSVWTDLDGTRTSSEIELGLLDIEWHDGDEFSLDLEFETDRPGEDFEVADGVTVVAGDYDWAELSTSYEWTSVRPWSGRIRVSGGDWYDGDLVSASGRLSFRPSPRVRAELEYSEQHGSLPSGDFVVRLERFRLDHDFTTELSWQNLVQADNQSDSLGLQSRLHWLLEDGRELFVVLGSGWLELPDGSVVPEAHDLTIKFVYAIRF